MTVPYRVGLGYDLHTVVADRKLYLGGIEIECAFGLGGHTDGDVVLHAVIDALFGAAGLPDIGEAFPDTDPQWAGASSRLLLKQALSKVTACGYQVKNVDVTIIAEAPRLAAYKSAMRSSLTSLLSIDLESVSIKAKTNEGQDAVGEKRAIACQAVVLLEGF